MQSGLKNNVTMKYSVLYFISYWPLGALCPLIGQYLSSIGFSGAQVGITTSLGTGISIFAGMFWGKIYSNTKKKKWILVGMCLSAALLSIVSTSTKLFVIYALIYCGMYFFQGPFYGLCDTLVLHRGGDFSKVRSLGAVGYALAVFVAGTAAQTFGLKIIFYLYAAAFSISALILFGEQQIPNYNEKNENIKISHLFRDKDFTQLLISIFFVTGTNIANSTYFGYLFIEGGGDIAGIGAAFLLMAGSEAPFMTLTPKLVKKFSSEKLILCAIILSALRFAFYSTEPSSGLLLGTFFLQGMVNGVLLVEVVKYFGKVVEPKYTGLAISMYYAVGTSLSVIVCSITGGILLDVSGAGGVYRFFSLYNVIAVILYLIMGLHKEPSERTQKKSKKVEKGY